MNAESHIKVKLQRSVRGSVMGFIAVPALFPGKPLSLHLDLKIKFMSGSGSFMIVAPI